MAYIPCTPHAHSWSSILRWLGDCSIRSTSYGIMCSWLKCCMPAASSPSFWHETVSTLLARLWYTHGKQQQAGELLDLVYGWFTVGIDAAD